MARDIHIPDQVHAELVNWSRWCWTGEWPHPLPATHCGSIESQYKPPASWIEDAEDAMRQPTIRPNAQRAQIVQGVYDRLEGYGRLVLKSEYPCRAQRGTREQAARRIGITLYQYENWLAYAVRQVEGAFSAVR